MRRIGLCVVGCAVLLAACGTVPVQAPVVLQQSVEEPTPTKPVLVDIVLPTEGFVVRIVDGDTFAIGVDANGDGNLDVNSHSPSGFQEQAVRPIGIDSPEIRDRDEDRAYHRLAELIEGKVVKLEYQKLRWQPYFGGIRLLCDVYVMDEETGEWIFVNAVLVAEGLVEASPYGKNRLHETCLSELQKAAKKRGSGIWRIYKHSKKSAVRRHRRAAFHFGCQIGCQKSFFVIFFAN